MRIFQLSPVFESVGGIETYVRRVTESLLSRGHQTALAVPDVTPRPGRAYEVMGLPELAWRQARDPMAGRHRILETVRKFRPDCVLLHQVGDGELLRMLHKEHLTVDFVHVFVCRGAKLFRRNDQACQHPLGLRCLLDWYVGPCGAQPSPKVAITSLGQAREYIRALATIDLVLVGSQFMKQYLIDEGLDGDRIDVVDMALGLSPAPEVKRPSGDPHIVYVGRAVYVKGIQYLIRSLSLLHSGYRLTIVGDGWYLNRLKALARELGIEQRVRFVGVLQGPALNAVLESATVAVVPSIFPEPSGLVVPEMRRHGLPVVVTNVGGLREWTSRYSSIYLADPANHGSLAQAIRSAVEEEDKESASPAMAGPNQLPALLESLYADRAYRQELALSR